MIRYQPEVNARNRFHGKPEIMRVLTILLVVLGLSFATFGQSQNAPDARWKSVNQWKMQWDVPGSLNPEM